MKFRTPININFLHVDDDTLIDIGHLEEDEFNAWFAEYSTGLKEHWKQRKENLKNKKANLSRP